MTASSQRERGAAARRVRTSFDAWPCSVARVMDVFGDAWTPLLMRDAFHGLRRFEEFQRSLNLARNTLTDRLNRLVDAGLLTRSRYQDRPPRDEYLLTDAGADFFPVLAAMLAWGDRWLDDGAGAPVTLAHGPDRHAAEPVVVCAACQDALALPEVEFRVGPGWPEGLPPELDNRARFLPPEPLP
jgi:DNA-binding HxlR family transcriptional regulator